MAKIVNEIVRKRKNEIYVGDLVTVDGKFGILCVDEGCYYIQGFEGYQLKSYGGNYHLVDEDDDVELVCNRHSLTITLGGELG